MIKGNIFKFRQTPKADRYQGSLEIGYWRGV